MNENLPAVLPALDLRDKCTLKDEQSTASIARQRSAVEAFRTRSRVLPVFCPAALLLGHTYRARRQKSIAIA